MRVNLCALIPAFNEETLIEKTLESIIEAGMDKKDIYVIDDCSSDNTKTIAESLGVYVFSNSENLGKADSVKGALNSLNLLDRYSHICFLDADTIVDSHYFQVIRKKLSDDSKFCEKSNRKGKKVRPIGVLCGKARSLPSNYLTAFRAYEYWLAHAIHKPAQAKMSVILVAPGCASTYNTETLRKVVWSKDTVVEDMDITVQASLSGERIEYLGSAIVYTQDPKLLRDFCGQLGKRWYKGTWQVMRKHNLIFGRWERKLSWECRMVCAEPLVYLSTLLYLLFFHQKEFLWLSFSSTAIIFLLAGIAGVQEKRKDIFLYSFTYPFLSILSLFLFTGTLPNLFQKKGVENHWYRPKRYENEMFRKGETGEA
jgi:cellulose synthase/poly-beta-1,6-N-acetylglucosamine synthase-like glycosyltransferase